MEIKVSLKKVLVIEDNPGDFLLVEDFLLEKFNAITIINAPDYKSANDFLSKEEGISLILLDFFLPDLKGLELVKNIQRMQGDIPILVLTGYGDLDLAKEILSLGISDFLIKDELTPDLLYKSVLYAIERKRFVYGLSQSKRSYQNLFDFGPQPMWIFDIKNLRFLDVNKAAVLKYEYSKEEFLGMTIRDIRPASEQRNLDQNLSKSEISSGYQGVFKHKVKNGKLIDVEIYTKDIEYEGSIVRLILANDVTEKLTHLNTIERQNEKFRKIAWTQSHILRAPVSRMMGLMNLMEFENYNSEDLPFLMETFKTSLLELDDIIRDIVDESQELKLNQGDKK